MGNRMTTAAIVWLTRPRLPAMAPLAVSLRRRLLESIAAGESQTAYEYARLLAYVAVHA